MAFAHADGLQPICVRQTHPETMPSGQEGRLGPRPEFRDGKVASLWEGSRKTARFPSRSLGWVVRAWMCVTGLCSVRIRDGFRARGWVATHLEAWNPSRNAAVGRAGSAGQGRSPRAGKLATGPVRAFGMGTSLRCGKFPARLRGSHPEVDARRGMRPEGSRERHSGARTTGAPRDGRISIPRGSRYVRCGVYAVVRVIRRASPARAAFDSASAARSAGEPSSLDAST